MLQIGELGMIIAASPDVMVVNPEDVPADVLSKEQDVEMGKEDIKSKPEAVRFGGGEEEGGAS